MTKNIFKNFITTMLVISSMVLAQDEQDVDAIEKARQAKEAAEKAAAEASAATEAAIEAAAQKAAIEVLMSEPEHHARLWENTNYFRKELQSMGFDTGDSVTPIIPVMCGESSTAKAMTHALGDEGVMAGAIVFPMVARDKARIRTQMSAGLTRDDLDAVLRWFEKVGPQGGGI